MSLARAAAQCLLVITSAVLCAGCEMQSSHERAAALADKAARAEQGGQLAEAEGFYTSAVSESASGDNVLQLPSLLISLAAVYRQERKFADSQNALKRAVQCYKAAAANTSLNDSERTPLQDSLVGCLLNLANTERDGGNLQEAENTYNQALAENAKVLSQINKRTEIEREYTQLLRKQGKAQEALAMSIQSAAADLIPADWDHDYDECLQDVLKGRIKDESDSRVQTLLKAAQSYSAKRRLCLICLVIAQLRMEHGDFAGGESMLNESIAADEEMERQDTKGKRIHDPVRKAQGLALLAIAQEAQGKRDQAHKTLDEEKRTIRKRIASSWVKGPYGDAAIETIGSVTAAFVQMLQRQRQYKGAEIALRSLLSIIDSAPGLKETERLTQKSIATEGLADALYRQQKYEEAEAYFDQDLAWRRKTTSLGESRTIFILKEAADNFAQQKKTSEADKLYKEAISLCDKTKHAPGKQWTAKMQEEFELQCGNCKKRYAAFLRKKNGSVRSTKISSE